MFCRLPIPRLSAFPPGLLAPPSLSASGMHMPVSSAPSTSNAPMPGSSTLLSLSGRLPIPESSATSPSDHLPVLELSAPSPSGCLLVSGLSAPSPSGCLSVPGSSTLSLFGCLPVSGSFVPSPSGCLLVPRLSPPGLSSLFLIWSFRQTPMPVLRKQRLDQ